ncbi:MAG TPA: metallophosphoesterase family protein, partial [Clostridia bacterium]|nr:metallophosphoesterase family protein [Clostridia bacterium]
MIAILSDIHGNLPALEAVLADLPPVREIWLLGDLLGELPYPREVMGKLQALERDLPVRAVAGNREVSLLEIRDGLHEDWRQGTQLSALTWTADQLEPRHWEW